jgi:quinol monooxygenase YgiN
MLIVAGVIHLDPSKRAQLETVFNRVRQATLKEPGCLEYQAYLDREAPGTVFLFERWESDTALAAHFQTAHMAEFTAALAGVGVHGTDIRKYEVGNETRLM